MGSSHGFCVDARTPKGLLSEDFLIGKDGALQGVIVYVKKGAETVKVPVPDEPVVLDQRNCQYIPHVAVLQIGVMVVALFTVHLGAGFSFMNIIGMSEAGPQFGIPGFEINLLYIAGLSALLLGGAGALSVDRFLATLAARRTAAAPIQERAAAVTS